MSISGVGGVSPTIMSGASMRMPPQQKMTNLFNMIDTSGTGSIDKSQLGAAFQNLNPPVPFKKAGLDYVWGQLDPNNTASVSESDFVSGMTQMMVSLRSQSSGG
jgi:Ca2+-binding EF-hand superfamily protein